MKVNGFESKSNSNQSRTDKRDSAADSASGRIRSKSDGSERENSEENAVLIVGHLQFLGFSEPVPLIEVFEGHQVIILLRQGAKSLHK
ncbi:unnamed protein product [Nippostrongylus brasiliensis]|uniref:Uncharacterized protein n=1 Tax=Nippostrongylus brasiliensis TaxID=27835 RepID=A0A0N4YDU0_NIPBR|nr:unnamed protein product [Nippostrongylus brasiliensis]